MANCVTLINVMKLLRDFDFLRSPRSFSPKTSQPVAPGSVRPDGAYQVGNGGSPPSVMFRTTCEIPDLARKVRAQGEVKHYSHVRMAAKRSALEKLESGLMGGPSATSLPESRKRIETLRHNHSLQLFPLFVSA